MTIWDAFSVVWKSIDAVIGWATAIFDAVPGSTFLVLGCFALLMVCVLFIAPLRGPGVVGFGGTSDFIKQATYKPKHWNGQTVKASGYKGKYDKRRVKVVKDSRSV